MRNYGVIGYPIAHTFSPGYFEKRFVNEGITDATYRAFSIQYLTELGDLIEQNNLNGFNVTIPHKQSIVSYLNELDTPAAEMQAVNCVKVVNGRLIGFNTDYIAFKTTLANIAKHGQKALIFGSGGSSLAVKYALHSLGIEYQVISRNPELGVTYQDVDKAMLTEHKILINTTPLGMYPNLDACVKIPYKALTLEHVCYDLVYNPVETLFLKNAREQGAKIKNGLEMLEIQADKSWDIWNS